MRFSSMAIAVALVAGCATQSVTTTTEPAPVPAPAPKVNLAGYPPEFRQGYTDGCASANAARKRDEARFKSDANYATGWRDGLAMCKARKG